MKGWIKAVLGILLLLLLVGGGFGYVIYTKLFTKNVADTLPTEFVCVKTGWTFTNLVDFLYEDGILLDKNSFYLACKLRKYEPEKARAGRYKIKPGMNNIELLRALRGAQAECKLVMHNKRTVEELAGLAGKIIEADSMELVTIFYDKELLTTLGYTPETLMSMFIPNTYNLYWNTNARQFLERMKKEHDKFWQQNGRMEKAETLGLSQAEVYTLASIVETETRRNEEKSRIAGVYLNRIKKGWPLQADPTVVFALKAFGLRRVLNEHLEVDSPYNTYKNLGLPPGPIYMSSISSIDKTLDAEDHNYMYFCARPDESGMHAFAETLNGHKVNARKYHRWLRSRDI